MKLRIIMKTFLNVFTMFAPGGHNYVIVYNNETTLKC